MTCTRSITFDILNKFGVPVLKVKATEVNGALVFEVTVVGTGNKGDLRGLFFDLADDTKMAGLAITNSDGKIVELATNNVTDLGNGANMNGTGSVFDVGIEFGNPGKAKDIVRTSTFTLDNAGHSLTLDDIAHVEFGTKIDGTSGPSKSVYVSPAAPNAQDDSYSIFEDGQSGLNDPSKTSDGVVFQVLDNDTDADGDTLTITDVEGALHGTLTIVDGDDADLLAGDAVLYTPDLDYAGTDSFTYCITDNNGGTDFAEVDVAVEAVADVPTLTYTVAAGATVNEIIIKVTATQNDADGSEFIDRIDISGVPAGVTMVPGSINPGDQPGQIIQEFVLTVPLGQDTNFDLGITAWSEETSNGDQESATATLPIVFEYNSTTNSIEFTAQDQSIWSTGDEFTFVDDRFVGIDTGNFDEQIGSTLYAGVDGHIKLGFQSTLTFEGGEIDAVSNYDITVETSFNKTTDQLQIDTGALLSAASFDTVGPQGSYVLDFVYDIFLHAFAGVDIDFGEIDFGVGVLDLGGIKEQVDVNVGPIGPGDFNIIDLDSSELEGTIEFPPPLNSLSVNFDWPDITTSGSDTAPPPFSTVSATGSSNNFLELVLDVDTLVTQLLGIPNVFDPPKLNAGPFFADLDILDVDVIGGLNFLQEFAMTLGDLVGILQFEDGSSQAFTIGDSLLLDNASLIDDGGDNDGLVEFDFIVAPAATLANETDLGFNIGAEISLLTLELGYGVTIPNPFGPDVELGDSITLGPVADFGESTPVADINVFDETFNLNFGSESVSFLA